ncbi:MAG: 50S ribosomal protein L15 [Chloroflexi bacterium]|nr:50S ribosomal protein L15 [Chloroflexota bacterium]|tara:strand:+ start:3014 stop:3463 length:450 start_codon:yes stop_codon:yes gene_type:complete
MSGLHQLKSNKKNRKRVGRGNGSGHGTYSGRGSKGQKQRGSVPFLFEGGQLPLIKKLPHMRGFNNIFKTKYSLVNLDILNQFKDGDNISKEILIEKNIIKNKKQKLKILASGKLSKKLNVTANHFSKSAKEQIESLGGSVTIIDEEKKK